MPDAFQFPYAAASLLDGALPESRTDIWIPSQLPPNIPPGLARRGRVTARMKSGVALEAATAELRVVAARVEEDLYRGTRSRVGVRVVPLAEEVIEPVRRSLWTLLAAAALVLAAACANVANLMLARMTVRAGEVLTRAALGAGRLRIVRQFLGVISYNVTARVREFALRLALGSDEVRLKRLVFRRGVRLTLIGLAIGVVVSLQLVVVTEALPIESRPDIPLIAAIAGLLLVIALAASAIPAMRVARVNPVVALRQD